MFDLIREISQTLRCNKLRTTLTGIAVAWGIFMLIVLVGMTKGVINNFERNMGSQGANTIRVWSGYTSEPWHGYREGRRIMLRSRDMGTLKSANPSSVNDVTSTIYGGGTISTQENYTSAGYSGVYPSQQRIDRITMTAGRYINDRDIDERRKVMVLSNMLASTLFPRLKPEEIIGKTVDCTNLGWTIVGVFDSRWNNSAYIPFTTAQMLQADSEDIGSMVVEMKNVNTEADALKTEADVRSTLASAHDFKADDQSAIWLWNRFQQYLQTQEGMKILNAAMWIIGIFTLLSGIVGVSNIMFVSVRERTHEIGIRRAIGARPRSILTQIIMESVAITALFGYIGIVMGIGVTEILARLFENSDFIHNPRVDVSLAIEVTCVLIVAGALAGIFPAMNAIKIKPVEALRDE